MARMVKKETRTSLVLHEDGTTHVDVRVWRKYEGVRDWRPGKGVRLPVEDANDIAAAIVKAVARHDRATKVAA